jgi:predicted transposase/invertase (TIGR01784 family)
MKRFLDPKNDLPFKRLFGTEKNKDILIAFLNSVFDGVQAPIEDLSFIPIHKNPEIVALRESIIDVMCRSTDGKEFIIEMQCTRDGSFLKRACTYVAKVYCSQNTSKGYRELKPVIFFRHRQRQSCFRKRSIICCTINCVSSPMVNATFRNFLSHS